MPPTSVDEPVVLDRSESVAIVTLNRPDRRNALDVELKVALRETLRDVAADSSVRAVVLAAAGRVFCVGQDLDEHAAALADSPAAAFATVDEHYTPIVEALATMPKPVVAAVGGTCVGAGLGLALACDLRVFGAGVTLGTAFSGIGLTCDSGLSHTLPRAVGQARASELVLLATPFKAEQAVEWGISGRIVDAGEVLDAARELAARLASGPTAAFAESKRLLAASFDTDLADALAAESAAQLRAGSTADHARAVNAFQHKQTPVFDGR